MLGYLQMQKSELLVKEAETYKAVYCSLCRTLGKDYSFFCRAFLSYDFTFYALLLMALDKDKCPGFKKGRCCCNPLKSCNYCEDAPALHSSAALTVITAYYKLCDDISDSGALKSTISRFVRLFVSRQRKKALKSYSEFDDLLCTMMLKQNEIEKKSSPNIDECCEPTAQMLAGVFSANAENEDDRRILSEMGYHIGRWIYLADAADDLEKDIKNGNFNSLIPLFTKCENRVKFAEECNALMNMAIAAAFRAYQLLDVNKFNGILNNHFVYGMPSMQKIILYRENRKGKKENEQSV